MLQIANFMRLILPKILFLSLFTCYVSKEAECVRQLNKADALKVSRTVQLFVSKPEHFILYTTVWACPEGRSAAPQTALFFASLF